MKLERNTPTQSELDTAYRLLKRITPKIADIEAAGAFLAKKRVFYPQFLEELVALHPELNLFTLNLYADVGDKKFYAPYVIYASAGVIIQKIAQLPFETQKKIYHEGVDLLVGNEVVRYKFYDVTPKLVRLLFDGTHVRTIEEQKQKLARPVKPRPGLGKSRYTIDKDKVRIGNVTLFKKDVMAIAQKILNLDDILELLQATRSLNTVKRG